MNENPYSVRISRWSPTNDLIEALDNVTKEVAEKMRTAKVPLEVRVSAMEEFLVEVGSLSTLAALTHHDEAPVERSIDMVRTAIEFLRLDTLFDAVELYELQKGQQ